MDALLLSAGFVLLLILILYALIKIQEKRKNEKELQLAEQYALKQRLEEEENQRKRELLIGNREAIQKSVTEYQKLNDSDRYFTIKSYREWDARFNYLKPFLQNDISIDINFDTTIRSLRNYFSLGEKGVRKRNEIYVTKELSNYETLFNSFQGKSLTENQSRAAIIDEQHNLVVAGAGTGKTHTLLAKAAYINLKGLSKPENILLMSFNRNVKEEIIEKCQKLYLPCQVETFHSLGLRLIAEANLEKPSVTKLDEDRNKFVTYIQRCIDHLTGNAQNKTLTDFLPESNNDSQLYRKKLVDYFSYYSREYINPIDFETLGDYYKYIKDNGLTTLKNDKVKSFEEFEIANYLFLNGVDYKYEAKYEHETADINHRQYQPDFYLPKNGLYIEHFALNRRGNTPPFIKEWEYKQSIEWKKSTHQKFGTILLETYSYEHDEGTLLKNLESKLQERGVSLEPISSDEVLKVFRESDEVTLFANLVAKFLNLFKASGQSLQEVRKTAETYRDPGRAQAFLDLFEPILELYQSELKTNHDVDFNDMINEATAVLEAGQVKTNFNYILVDEFQDISQSRFKFLKTLQQNSGAKLFCVGDDWQAIYRFTGGDVSLMTHFQDYFEPSERLNLDKTFRFNSGILEVSSRFITRNTTQLKKELVTDYITTIPTVTLKWAKKGDKIEECLSLIEEFHNEKENRVFILGRYRQNSFIDLEQVRKDHPGLEIEFHTVHGSKGLEADYVILVEANGGVKGFPCLIEDDPLLSLVLSRAEEFPNAEERRLFYVALTRARKGVYVLSDLLNPSDFVEEMIKDQYPINYNSDSKNIPTCPICLRGKMTPAYGKFGPYYRCSNHPLCKYSRNTLIETRPLNRQSYRSKRR